MLNTHRASLELGLRDFFPRGGAEPALEGENAQFVWELLFLEFFGDPISRMAFVAEAIKPVFLRGFGCDDNAPSAALSVNNLIFRHDKPAVDKNQPDLYANTRPKI
jgi:hypothetical protein